MPAICCGESTCCWLTCIVVPFHSRSRIESHKNWNWRDLLARHRLPSPTAVGERAPGGGRFLALWRRHLAVGSILPAMWLPLSVRESVPVDLEGTYLCATGGLSKLSTGALSCCSFPKINPPDLLHTPLPLDLLSLLNSAGSVEILSSRCIFGPVSNAQRGKTDAFLHFRDSVQIDPDHLVVKWFLISSFLSSTVKPNVFS